MVPISVRQCRYNQYVDLFCDVREKLEERIIDVYCIYAAYH